MKLSIITMTPRPMRLRDSFLALLGRTASEAPELVVERVRLAMLNALDQHCDQDHVRVDTAIQYAKDIAELWYIRPDLMHAISSCRGQTEAQEVMHKITALFRGHYGSANNSRFGAL